MDSGWREVADVALTWLAAQSLAGSRPTAAAAPSATP
jgi:hypothetical protein